MFAAIGVIGRGDVARPPIAWLEAEKYANFDCRSIVPK